MRNLLILSVLALLPASALPAAVPTTGFHRDANNSVVPDVGVSILGEAPPSSTMLSATPAAGDSVAGPFVPTPGQDIRVIITGTGWTGQINVGTSSATEACATFNPLTIGGATWASFSADANEVVDTAKYADVVYCVQFVGITGSPTVRIR